MRNDAVLTLAAGLGLVAPASIGLLLTGVPTLICPLPALTILPALILSSWPGQAYRYVVLLPSVLFFAWNLSLFRGKALIPKRSIVLLAITTGLSVVYFVKFWKDGVRYEGSKFTELVCLVNALWLLLLWIMLARRWKASSFADSLLFHWVLFAWLAWYAFPYLGELP